MLNLKYKLQISSLLGISIGFIRRMIDYGSGSLRVCIQSLKKNAIQYNTILFFLQKLIIGIQKTHNLYGYVKLVKWV
jgi:hypothetical protein